MLFNYKGKDHNFALEKSGRLRLNRLNRVIKVDNVSNGKIQYHVKNTTVIFLTKKNVYLNPNKGKFQTNPTEGYSTKIQKYFKM